MNKFFNEIMESNQEIFSIDKIVSADKKAAKIIVLFNNNTMKTKIVKNDYKVRRQYQYLRKHKLGLTL